ncbi:muropeptide transporter [Pirellulimonas nuda]|uniref:Muropeptide transporter n=1 Tax=Pirellulimonas nuda TaxID=2528009 RepID=A0A518DAJ9_9BACT|nr:hypothetical protein [Pirellulimonas nuda]QDU88511.1 muropeptide transporter [Pirellulimonas nuda]
MPDALANEPTSSVAPQGAAPPAAPYRPSRAAWGWVPSLYFAQGLPYAIAMTLAGDMYVLLDVPIDSMAFYTGLLGMPWVLKPLWSPLVDVLGTQRRWILATQAAIVLGLAGVAALTPTAGFFFATLCFFWMIAISSATHDIAADGFYMVGLSDRDQAWYVGIRSTFYRAAMFFVSAFLLAMAGELSDIMPPQQAWAWTFTAAAVLFFLLNVYHCFALPKRAAPRREQSSDLRSLYAQMVESFVSFFRKPGIGIGLAYLLLYRFAESQLAKIAKPFMFAPREEGGLALTEQSVAVLYGTFGIALLTLGGILGGFAVAKYGLRRWLLPMALALNVPNILYVLLALAQPTNSLVIGLAIGVEQFGYGFGFAAYMLYMLRLSRGEHQTAHYALCTGLMALGAMLPSMIAGKLQMQLGYLGFFVWVVAATIPSLAVTLFTPVDDDPVEPA